MGNPLEEFFQHSAVKKVAAIVAYVGVIHTTAKFVLCHDGGLDVGFTPFTIDDLHINVFWRYLFFFQLFFVFQFFSKDTAASEAAHNGTWTYFGWALFQSLWAWSFSNGWFWWAFVFAALQVVATGCSFVYGKTASISPVSRWWFIHFASSSLPVAWSHYVFWWTLSLATDWTGNVGEILGLVFVWWFFLAPAWTLNRHHDWGTGLAFTFLAWGIYKAHKGHTILGWFTLAIAILNTLYTFVVGYPDIPSGAVERSGENAPLLSGEA
ncbi:hypothetical protein TRVA0_008S02586 [Trichomonascus vanleenenianus]|uniref:uncharacterized protein n=1 Tax=Trichomonascus vanleenenianus TaxID=2268995 RepID=UPI003EC97988